VESHAFLKVVVGELREEFVFKQVLVPVVTVGEPERVASRGGFLGWFVHVQQLELFGGVKRDL